VRLLWTNVLLRGCVTAVAGVALLITFTSTTSAADRQPSPHVVPVAVTQATEFVTQPTPLQAPALTTTTGQEESRGANYTLDETSMTATLTSGLRADPPTFSPYIGNNRRVSNGNHLVSYGATGRMVEFNGTQPVFTGTFDEGRSSYRTERADWSATPATPPDVVVDALTDHGTRTVHVSWNGATEVDSWRIEAGPGEDELTALGVTPKTGFDTAAEVVAPGDADIFRVAALDGSGEALDTRTLAVS
jgi:hypothetical protein